MRRLCYGMTLVRDNWFSTIRNSGLTRELSLSNECSMVGGEIQSSFNHTLSELSGFKA